MNAPTPPAALVERLRDANRIVVLTGAGMSAESGIPTFREQGSGMWSRFDPATLATSKAFEQSPDTVWAWYEWRRRLVARAQPNPGHIALRTLSTRPGLASLTIVTQNVDDLHERAGSAGVLHLHGSLFAPRCFRCATPFAGLREAIELPDDDLPVVEPEVSRLAPPRCIKCDGPVRPGVVWFGESLPEAVWLGALEKIEEADLLLVIGTSGLVYPAASLPETARRHGCDVAVINPDASTLDTDGALGHAGNPPRNEAGIQMDWQIHAAIGLPKLVETACSDRFAS